AEGCVEMRSQQDGGACRIAMGGEPYLRAVRDRQALHGILRSTLTQFLFASTRLRYSSTASCNPFRLISAYSSLDAGPAPSGKVAIAITPIVRRQLSPSRSIR